MDKLKKSGMDMDMSIEQMDWVEDNKKVSNPIELHFMIPYPAHRKSFSGKGLLHLRIVSIEQ